MKREPVSLKHQRKAAMDTLEVLSKDTHGAMTRNVRDYIEALEADHEATKARADAYAILTKGMKTRIGHSFESASLRDFFGQTPEGYRCQRGCPGCQSLMKTEEDNDGRPKKRTYELPEHCPLLVLGLEEEPLVIIDWL